MQMRMMEMKVKSLEKEANLNKTMREYYKEQVTLLQLANKKLQVTVDDCKFSFRKAKDHCQLYTGLTEEVFEFFRSEIDPEVFKQFSGLSSHDILLLTMMRLRLNLPVKELALRFDLNKGSVHRYLEAMFPALRKAVEKHVTWVDRKECLSKMPSIFKLCKYSGVNSVVGCLEVFIKVQKILDSYRNKNKSKDQDSVKFLIATTPSGEITFTSNGKGGKLSDMAVTIESGYFSRLQSGDEVLTDSGIPLQKHCRLIDVCAHCPTDSVDNDTSSDPDSEEMRKLHRKSWGATIERMQNFSILSSRCPFSSVKYLDDIVFIIAAIINLQKRREDRKPLGRQKKKIIDDSKETVDIDENGEQIKSETESDKDLIDPDLEASNLYTVLVQTDPDSGGVSAATNEVEETLFITKHDKDNILTIKNEDGSITLVTVSEGDENLMAGSTLASTLSQQMALEVSDLDNQTGKTIVLQQPSGTNPIIVQSNNADETIYLLEQM